MKNLLLNWIADYKHFQEMPLEMVAEIDAFLEEHPNHPDNRDIKETKEYLVEHYNRLQDTINDLRIRIIGGHRVILAEEKEEVSNESHT